MRVVFNYERQNSLKEPMAIALELLTDSSVIRC